MKTNLLPVLDIVGIERNKSHKNRQIMKEKTLDKLVKHRLKWELTI